MECIYQNPKIWLDCDFPLPPPMVLEGNTSSAYSSPSRSLLICIIYACVTTAVLQIQAGGRNSNRQSLVTTGEALRKKKTWHSTELFRKEQEESVQRYLLDELNRILHFTDSLRWPTKSQSWREASSKRVWSWTWARRCSLRRRWRWQSTSCTTSPSLSSPRCSEETSSRSNLTTGTVVDLARFVLESNRTDASFIVITHPLSSAVFFFFGSQKLWKLQLRFYLCHQLALFTVQCDYYIVVFRKKNMSHKLNLTKTII